MCGLLQGMAVYECSVTYFITDSGESDKKNIIMFLYTEPLYTARSTNLYFYLYNKNNCVIVCSVCNGVNIKCMIF